MSQVDDLPVDRIFAQFEHLRASLIKSLTAGIKDLEVWKIFSNDTFCAYRFNANPRSKWICEGCKTLSGITKLTPDMQTFKITVGKYQKKSFTIEKFPKMEIFWKYDREPNFRAMRFLRTENFQSCCPELGTQVIYVETDVFTARLINSIYLDSIKSTLSIPNIKTITGFACSDNYYLITEKAINITDIISPNNRMHIDDADCISSILIVSVSTLSDVLIVKISSANSSSLSDIL